MRYRREIDGLRAIAVIPVVLFHAGFGIFRGGFVGVDVFFVISGYLITSIILDEHERGRFSLLRFYERRARRILPALFVVMLACLPVAFLWMLPDYLENFGESIVATTLFANNILLWRTTGYFALENEFRPMLHTWSLGVEEQFYLVFPLILLLLLGLTRRYRSLVLGLMAAISLGFAQWATKHSPSAAFYLLPFRMWELLAGAILALYLRSSQEARSGSSNFASVAGFLGLALLAYPVFTFDGNTPFPGFNALLPVCGTALIIAFSGPDNFTGRLLGSKVFVGLGLISYSTYLWHQPLLVFARITSLQEPSRLTYAILCLLAVAFAAATWKFVEQPFRNRARTGTVVLVSSSLAGGILVCGLGALIYFNSGFVHRWKELNTDIAASGRNLNAAYNEEPFRLKNHVFVEKNRKHVLILGNSFARDFINAGLANGYFSSSELSYSDQNPECMNSAGELDPRLRELVSRADYVVLASPSTALLQCWQKVMTLLQEIGADEVIFIGTKNFGWNLNAVMRLDEGERRSYRARVRDDVREQNEAMVKAFPPQLFVNILALISDANGRVPVFTPEGKIISQDGKHLTKDGARFVGSVLFEHPLLVPLK